MKHVLILRSVIVLSLAASATYGCATREQTGQVLGGAAGAAAAPKWVVEAVVQLPP